MILAQWSGRQAPRPLHLLLQPGEDRRGGLDGGQQDLREEEEVDDARSDCCVTFVQIVL